MKKTISIYDFVDTFKLSPTYKDNFSIDGLYGLFDYFEQIENDCDMEIDFDMVGICCEYSEYSSAIDCYTSITNEDITELGETEEEQEEAALDYLRDNTQVIEFEGGIIIKDFNI